MNLQSIANIFRTIRGAAQARMEVRQTGIVPGLTIDTLVPVVRALLDHPSARVLDFTCQPPVGAPGQNSTVYRVSGSAHTGELASWQVQLKITRRTPEREDPASQGYWKREARAYQSGMLQHLPGGVSAPRCYGVTEYPASLWLWLEPVPDQQGPHWSLETFAQAALHLGRFNGEYLNGCPIPAHDWLPRDWLRRGVEQSAPAMRFLRDYPHHPLVRQQAGGDTGWLLLGWEERCRLLDLLEGMPQVLCHQNAMRGHLFLQGSHLLAVDWSALGAAPLGAELAALVGGSLLHQQAAGIAPRALEQAAMRGYLQGLAETGCAFDPAQVRLAYCLTLFLRYAIAGTAGELSGLLSGAQAPCAEEERGLGSSSAAAEGPALAGYFRSVLAEGIHRLGLGRLASMAGRAVLRAVSSKKYP